MADVMEGFVGHGMRAGMAMAVVVMACGGSTGPGTGDRTHPALAQIDSVLVGGSAYGVAISSKGRTYVTLINGNTVVQDDTLPVDSFGDAIAVGLVPPHVTFNPAGDRAFVVAQTGQMLTRINVSTGAAIDSVALPADGFNLITSADGSEVFVSVSTGQVYVVNASSLAIVDSIILPPAVNGFARHPTRNRIYVSSRDGGSVVEVNATTHQIRRTFTTGGMPQRLAVSPDGRELIIANEILGVDIWSLSTGTRDTTLGVIAYGLGLSPDGLKIYVASGPTGVITVVDRLSRTVDTSIVVGGVTRNVAFDRKGETAVITNESGFVTVIR